jgi:pimeloyl-ACP methyl ester carboxylesterase
VLNKAAGYSVEVRGVKWAYRKSDPPEAKASADKLPVLLLHGLGSSSWSYRYCCLHQGYGVCLSCLVSSVVHHPGLLLPVLTKLPQ